MRMRPLMECVAAVGVAAGVLVCAVGAGADVGGGNPAAKAGPPYTVVATPTTAAVLSLGLGDDTSRVWLDGGVLWIATRSVGGPWRSIGGVSHDLARIGDSDVWAVGLAWDAWDAAFMDVTLLSDAPGEDATEPIRLSWRGENAPAAVQTLEPGLVETFTVPGPVDGEERSVTVALPPGYARLGALPAVVLADGQSAASWGGVVAALVEAGAAQPVAVIGVHSAAYAGERGQPYNPELDVRAREYLSFFDPERFAAHLDWVVETVLPAVASRHPVSLERDRLAVAGFSNGGAFAASAAVRRSDVFGMALALSVASPPEMEHLDPDARPLRFYLAAGELEPNFLRQTVKTRDAVLAAGGTARLLTYASGHDASMWRRAAAELIPEMFPAVDREAGAGVPEAGAGVPEAGAGR